MQLADLTNVDVSEPPKSSCYRVTIFDRSVVDLDRRDMAR